MENWQSNNIQLPKHPNKNHSPNIKKPPFPPLAPLLDPLPGYPPGGRGGLGGPEAGEAPSELPLARTAGGGMACTGVSSSSRGWWSAWIIRVFSFFLISITIKYISITIDWQSMFCIYYLSYGSMNYLLYKYNWFIDYPKLSLNYLSNIY